jgi:hypothetical protein
VSKLKSDLQQLVTDLKQKKMDPTVQTVTDLFNNKNDEIQGISPLSHTL